jgi:hypothetical protein
MCSGTREKSRRGETRVRPDVSVVAGALRSSDGVAHKEALVSASHASLTSNILSS